MSDQTDSIRLESAELRDAAGRLWASDVNLRIQKGAKVGIIADKPEAGAALLRSIAQHAGDVTTGFPEAKPDISPGVTVWDYVSEGVAELKAAIDRYDMITHEKLHPIDEDLHQWLDEQALIGKRLNAAGAWDLDVRMKDAMIGLRCPPAGTVIDTVEEADKRRIALARHLVAAADLLLLDDPSADLDADSSAWLEQNLQGQQPGTVVFASRDRALLQGAASQLIELRDGRVRWIGGGYVDWLAQRAKDLPYTGNSSRARRRAIDGEIAWVREGTPGRRAGATPGASTLQRFLAKRSASEDEPVELAIAPGTRLGDEVIGVEGLRKQAGNRVLIDALSFNLPPGAVVGITGPPRIGKSTLVRILAGREPIDGGTLHAADEVKLAHPDLNRLSPKSDQTVLVDFSAGRDTMELGERDFAARDILAALDFSVGDLDSAVSGLPEAGRERLRLAKTLCAGANVLVFDEPLHCLSLDARRALENAVIEFVGCVIVATNDRWFLNRVATHILAFEGDSQVVWFTGNHDAYVAHRMSRRGPGAVKTGWPRFKLVEPDDQAVAEASPAP